MKKFKLLFIFTLLIMNLSFFIDKAFSAASISVSNQGSQTIVGNNTIQSIIVDINKQSSWKVYITPLTNGLINTQNPTITIPLTRLTLKNSTTQDSFDLKYNELKEIASGNNFGTDRKPFDFILSNSSSDLPGDYTATFRFDIISGNDKVSTSYILRINRGITQSISLTPADINITIPAANLLQPNYSQEGTISENITLSSVIAWKLLLQGQTVSNGIDYSFKVVSIPTGATTPYNSTYYPLPMTDTNIVSSSLPIASGNVVVNYKILINKNGIQPAGNYVITIPYMITP